MMFQVRDEEDPESRAGRLARDRDHHAQVIKKIVILTTQKLWSELFMLTRSVVYRSAIKRIQSQGPGMMDGWPPWARR